MESSYPNGRTPSFFRGVGHQPDQLSEGFSETAFPKRFPHGFPMVSPWVFPWFPRDFVQGPDRNLAELTALRLDVLRLCQGAGPLGDSLWFFKGDIPSGYD